LVAALRELAGVTTAITSAKLQGVAFVFAVARGLLKATGRYTSYKFDTDRY
jgi:hypothetical protein